jgi:beta-lactamase regulating signal transducer with metallopeptidase domain
MWDYLITNTLMSLLALGMLFLLKDSPARLRFYVVITTLIAWFIPWHLVSGIPILAESASPFTKGVFSSLSWLETEQVGYVKGAVDSAVNINNVTLTDKVNFLFDIVTWGTVFGLTCAIGLILFIKDIVNYRSYLKHWYDFSVEDNSLWETHNFKKNNISIRILEGCTPGMATGLFKPIIWLNNKNRRSNTTKTILTHELTHILQNDPAWMWFINFIQRLFWWNPFVNLLAKIAREQIELSCDEKCYQQLQERYSDDLVNILLDEAKAPTQYIATISMQSGSNFNIKRVIKLTKEIKMKTKHLVVVTLGFSLFSFVGVAISQQDTSLTKNVTEIESKQQRPARIALYRDNKLHNELVDELLQITQLAKSHSEDTSKQILADLAEWNTNRRTSADQRSESALKIMSFTIGSYLLDKLNRYDEIPAFYDVMFPETPIEKALFLKHHVATAYIKMGLPEKALDLMADVIQRQPKPKSGSLSLIAQANLAAGNYNEVIAIAEQITGSSENKRAKIYAINLKRSAYLAMKEVDKANEMNNILTATYSVEASEPKLMGFASPLLPYLPEVNAI